MRSSRVGGLARNVTYELRLCATRHRSSIGAVFVSCSLACPNLLEGRGAGLLQAAWQVTRLFGPRDSQLEGGGRGSDASWGLRAKNH